jgi:hypothetical protein
MEIVDLNCSDDDLSEDDLETFIQSFPVERKHSVTCNISREGEGLEPEGATQSIETTWPPGGSF